MDECFSNVVYLFQGRGGGTEHVGAGVAHALACGAGAGVFLRVRDCELMLLAAPARGAMLPAPYLDSYGETDQVSDNIVFIPTPRRLSD